jgi:hypothetical protein
LLHLSGAQTKRDVSQRRTFPTTKQHLRLLSDKRHVNSTLQHSEAIADFASWLVGHRPAQCNTSLRAAFLYRVRLRVPPVRVPGYRSKGPALPLSLVSTIQVPLGRESSGSGLESREYGRRDPPRWPRDTPSIRKRWHKRRSLVD